MDDNAPLSIRGRLLVPGARTHGASGLEKLWEPESLESAIDGTDDVPLVDDDDQVIGTIDELSFDPDEGIQFEATVDDNVVAEKLDEGLVDVAPRLYHGPSDELEERDGAHVVTDCELDSIFVCDATSSGVPGVEETDFD